MNEFKIKKLNIFRLNGFKNLLTKVFHYEKINLNKYYFSLFPIFIQKMIRIFDHVRYSKYWVSIDKKGNIIGITGIYFRECDDKDVLWVSWFCVDQKYRRRGIGKTLLNHIISYAKTNNKKRFKIYTSNIEEEKKKLNN